MRFITLTLEMYVKVYVTLSELCSQIALLVYDNAKCLVYLLEESLTNCPGLAANSGNDDETKMEVNNLFLRLITTLPTESN